MLRFHMRKCTLDRALYHSFGRTDDRDDRARLSDAELIAQLSDMAKQLGVEISPNYSFYKRDE